MKALILAGGEGTRLRPLTIQVPKPVVPVANVPFLRYQLELLRQHGITETILSLGYQPDKVESVLGDGTRFQTRLHYVVESSPLGTAGAFKNAEPLLDGATVVFNGDILCDFDLTEVIRSHRRRSAVATLVLTQVDNPSAYGLVESEEDGRITRFLEKPSADEITCNTVNAGAYVLEPEVLKTIPAGENCSFERAVFPGLLASGQPVYAYISQGYWMDIGTPRKYLEAHGDILHRQFVPAVALPSLSLAGSPVKDHPAGAIKNSVVASSTQVGKGAQILSSAIGQDCWIGKQAVIDRSVLWSGVKVGDQAQLRGCIVGNHCEIGPHAVVAKGVVLGDYSRVSAYSQLVST